MTPPATHYAVSPRPYPERLPSIEYPGYFDVRRVAHSGLIYIGLPRDRKEVRQNWGHIGIARFAHRGPGQLTLATHDYGVSRQLAFFISLVRKKTLPLRRDLLR